MHRRGFILGLFLFCTLTLASLLTHSVAQVNQLPNPLVVVSNQGQAGPDVDKTLIRSTITDPAPDWRGRFFNPTGWQDAYPVMRASTWTTSTAIAPLLADRADHIWGGTPSGPLTPDAGNGTTYSNRFNAGNYDNGFPIPTGPSPQYLFLRRDFCLPINAQANALRRLTAGDISITLLNATDSITVPDGAASVWLNDSTIATAIPGDESGSTTLIDIPDPTFLFRGRNTLAMRVGDARSDERADILYHAAFGYAIDPNALTIGANTTMPFETELVQFDAVTDGLSDRTPFEYDWIFGDGDGAAGTTVYHTYTATGDYTATLAVADTESCTATTEIPISVLPFPLTITKTATPDPVTAGETLRYRITVQNASSVRALTNVIVADELPLGMTFSFCSNGCTPPTPPNRIVSWSLGTMGTESSVVLDLYVTIALTASGMLTNTTYGVQTNEVYTIGAPVAVEVLLPPCLQPLTGVDVTGPITGSIGNLYPFTGTIAPPDATEPNYYTWTPTPTAGQSTPNASYQWAMPGWYTLILRAENCGGAVTATHVISISSPCPRPLTDVGITGPTSGITGTWYDFISVITPTDATQPITLTWLPIPINGQGVHTATYQWATPGLHILTLTVENCGGVLNTTHAISISAPPPPITCPHPLTDISISGPTNGYTDTLYNFFAVPNPVDATEPVTLTWSPPPVSGQGAHTVTYQWATIGSHAITLTAENCGGVFATVHPIDIQIRHPAVVYLPLVLRNYPDDAPDDCPGWPLSIGEPFDEDFDHADDYDWFTFQATTGVSYTIRTQDLEIQADTVITLYDSTCSTPLATNDDLPYPSLSRASQIEWRATATGPLHVLVQNYESGYFGPDTGYSLAVYDENNPPPPIDDAPDVCAAATPLPIGQPYTNDFDHANDNDWFAFEVTVGRTYTITTSNLGTQANTVLELKDGECLVQLAVDDDPTDPEAQIVWLATADGQLRADVRPYDWTVYGPDTDYTVTIEEE